MADKTPVSPAAPAVDLKTKLITMLLTLLNNKLGGIVQWAVAAVLGYLTTYLTKLGVTLSSADTVQLASVLTGVFALLITSGMQWLQSKANISVQKALGPSVKQDGWIGPNTIAKVKELVKK